MSALFDMFAKRNPASPSGASACAAPDKPDNLVCPPPEVNLCSGLDAAGPASPNHTFALRSFPCVLGRHPACDHQLAFVHVSRRHCAFSVRGGQVWVEDLGSRNGTYLNGRPVKGLERLRDGDWLEMGYLPFRVRLAGPLAASGSVC
jgi:hypothetical protein